MKALTLYQPWASAMAMDLKRVETRPAWAMQMRSLVGADLAIHAGACSHWPTRYDLAAIHLAHTVPAEAMASLGEHVRYPFQWTLTEAPRGAIVAVVRVAAVMPTVPLDHQAMLEDEQYVLDSPADGGLHARLSWGEYLCIESERSWGDYTPGRVVVVTDNLRVLPEPVPARGHQRVWNVPDDVEVQVRSQLDAVA